MPYAQTVHIDQALTNLSIAYRNEGYVADELLPPVPVDKRSDRYFIYGRDPFKAKDDLVRPGATAPEWDRTLSTDFFNCERHAMRTLVTDDERRMSDSPLNPEADATELLTDQMMNNREYAILSVVTDPTQVTQTVALSGTSQWSDYTNSTPLTNIKTARSTVRNGVFREANTFALSYDVAITLADHPSVKDMQKYTSPGMISDSGLPMNIRGLRVVVAGAFKDTANDGATPTPVTAFGKNVLIAFVNPNTGLRTISFGYRFEAPDASTGARGFSVERYRWEERHGDYIEIATTWTQKLVAPLGGYLLTTAIA